MSLYKHSEHSRISWQLTDSNVFPLKEELSPNLFFYWSFFKKIFRHRCFLVAGIEVLQSDVKTFRANSRMYIILRAKKYN